MHKLLLVLIAVLFLAGSAQAQRNQKNVDSQSA